MAGPFLEQHASLFGLVNFGDTRAAGLGLRRTEARLRVEMLQQVHPLDTAKPAQTSARVSLARKPLPLVKLHALLGSAFPQA